MINVTLWWPASKGMPKWGCGVEGGKDCRCGNVGQLRNLGAFFLGQCGCEWRFYCGSRLWFNSFILQETSKFVIQRALRMFPLRVVLLWLNPDRNAYARASFCSTISSERYLGSQTFHVRTVQNFSYSDNRLQWQYLWSQKGPSCTENRRILWQSLTLTLLPTPTSVTVTEVLCNSDVMGPGTS